MQTNSLPNSATWNVCRSEKKGAKDEASKWNFSTTFYIIFFFILALKHLSFFNFTFLVTFHEFVEQESKVSCYHFSGACFMVSVLKDSFSHLYYFIWYFRLLRGAQERKHRYWILNAKVADGFKIEQLLCLAKGMCIDILMFVSMYWKQITLKTYFFFEQYCASLSIEESLPSINLIIKYIIDQHWYSI